MQLNPVMWNRRRHLLLLIIIIFLLSISISIRPDGILWSHIFLQSVHWMPD